MKFINPDFEQLEARIVPDLATGAVGVLLGTGCAPATAGDCGTGGGTVTGGSKASQVSHPSKVSHPSHATGGCA